MKRFIVFFLLATFLGDNYSQAQDTVWMKPGPLNSYYNGENWIDTTVRYVANPSFVPSASIIARQLVTPDTLQVYGIAAMMVPEGFAYNYYFPYSNPTEFQNHLESTYSDPSFDNCQEWLTLYQYHGDSSLPMQQLGDSLMVHVLYTPVSYFIMSNTPVVSFLDTIPKPVYERYFSSPQTVYDTFFAGFTQTNIGYDKDHDEWTAVRPYFCCMLIGSPDCTMSYETVVAGFLGGWGNSTGTWHFYRENSIGDYFIFPIIAPPDTSVIPNDTIINPGDTIVSGDLIVRSGNTVVIAPGDIIVIGGDTIVNTGDTLTVTLGDTVVISGHPIVINPGDTLTVNPGDTLFVNSDGSITVNPGGTIVVSSGGGGTSGIGIQTNDLLYRYTSVQPNPATDKVRVTSSFGLTRIETYDAKGRLVQTLPASGLKADLDISTWPRGTYLLRIVTPAGPTTKKLLVQ